MTAPLRYLLETNMVCDTAHNPEGRVGERIKAVGREQIAISIVVACEIRFGLAKIGPQITPRRLADNVRRILAELTVIALEPPADEHYADICNTLERAGTPIGPNQFDLRQRGKCLGRAASGRHVQPVLDRQAGHAHKLPTLSVTSVNPSARACAAISRSPQLC